MRPILEGRRVKISLKTSDGATALGAPPPAAEPQTQRAAAETGFPWTLVVVSIDPQADMDGFAYRRRLLLAGLAMILLLVFAGSYATACAFLRELAAARLQTDFVAAVSHEFRTPLASLLQLTENLADGRVDTEERRRTYYQGQARATGRLHRLVESLLDFGRMEAEVLRYGRESADAVALVNSTVGEFRQEVASLGFVIELSLENGRLTVMGDAEALERALWNLLDNAVKYSPDRRAIQVAVTRTAEKVAIAVSDRGLGIPADEQKEVFQKFYRGSAAVKAGIKETGIGLAMVQHIARAHGGDIRVESAPGSGSAFTLRLPLALQTTKGT